MEFLKCCQLLNIILEVYYVRPHGASVSGTPALDDLFLQIAFADWNPFITWMLFSLSLFIPFLIYTYLGIKYVFKEKYEKKEEGLVSRVLYFIRRNLDMKYKQLDDGNRIDSEVDYVFSQ